MNHRLAFLCVLPLLLAAPAPAQAPAPAPGSPESAALLDKACDKMRALGRGTFRTAEEEESALTRQFGGAGGGGVVEIEGGWHGDTTWGRAGETNELLVRHRGRAVVKSDDTWRLRRDKLPSGGPIPFVLDPDLFFQQLRDLPAAARKVQHVETAKVQTRDILVLALTLEGDEAVDFALSGALPAGSGGMGRVMIMGGRGRMRVPTPEIKVDIGLFVDPENGDVLRIRAKVYEKGGLPGGMRIAVGGAGGAIELADEGEEDAKPAADGKRVFKKGLPERKLGEQESMTYLLVDFADLGMASPPELNDQAKRLLGR